jgi:hypothetical protein
MEKPVTTIKIGPLDNILNNIHSGNLNLSSKEIKMIRILITVIAFTILSLPVEADFDPSVRPSIPDSLISISTVDKLLPYVHSGDETDRIAACMKLGEIGGLEAFQILVEIFEKEPFRPGIELPNGVRYYSLMAMGKIGVPEAESFLINIATEYSSHIDFSPKIHISADSFTVIQGAFDGLLELGTGSAIKFLESVYENDNFFWQIRTMAYTNILKYELKDKKYAATSDTSNLLLSLLTESDSQASLFDKEGNIDENYITQASTRFLLYNYRSSTLPFISEYILELPAGDPILPILRKLESNMTNNIPKNR